MKIKAAVCMLITVLAVPGLSFAIDYASFFKGSVGEKEVEFIFLGESGVLLKTANGSLIIDPAFNMGFEGIKQLNGTKVDLLLYTHKHADHFNLNGAVQIFNATGAQIIAEQTVADQLKGKIPPEKLIHAVANQTYNVGDTQIQTIKGQHIGPILLFRINSGDISIFHGGDSNYVPLAAYAADIAFIPTGSPSPTCSPEAAVKMAMDLNPQTVVTMHGTGSQKKAVKELLSLKMPRTETIVPIVNEKTVLSVKQ